MNLAVHFILGLVISFVGTIPPSMLNMTTAKISVEQSRNEALKFAYGVVSIVFIQAYLAIYFARFIHNNTTFQWYIAVVSIIIFMLLSYYFFKQARIEKRNQVKLTSKNNFFLGLTLSSLNMFAIPFYCGVSSSLNMSGLLIFSTKPILFFVLGSSLGTLLLLYLYAKSASLIQSKSKLLTQNLNYILSILTLIIALITFIKII